MDQWLQSLFVCYTWLAISTSYILTGMEVLAVWLLKLSSLQIKKGIRLAYINLSTHLADVLVEMEDVVLSLELTMTFLGNELKTNEIRIKEMDV